jgi:hypothetical protein
MRSRRSGPQTAGFAAVRVKSVDKIITAEPVTRAANAKVGSGEERTCFW